MEPENLVFLKKIISINLKRVAKNPYTVADI